MDLLFFRIYFKLLFLLLTLLFCPLKFQLIQFFKDNRNRISVSFGTFSINIKSSLIHLALNNLLKLSSDCDTKYPKFAKYLSVFRLFVGRFLLSSVVSLPRIVMRCCYMTSSPKNICRLGHRQVGHRCRGNSFSITVEVLTATDSLIPILYNH